MVGGAVQNSLRDILDAIFRYKIRVVVFVCVFVGAVVGYNVLAPDVYESEAKLLVRRGREDVSVNPGLEGASVTLVQNLESQVHSELAILTSQELVERVAQEIGPDKFRTRAIRGQRLREFLAKFGIGGGDGSLKRALKYFADNLAVDVERKSNIISVGFEAQDPELAHAALNRLVELYEERHIEVHAAKANPVFFEEQVALLKEELTASEKRLEDFRRQYGISSLDAQVESLLEQIRTVDALVSDARGRVSASEAQVEVLSKAVKNQEERVELHRITGVTNWAADDYKKRLAELRLREADLSARYAETHRPLVELRGQIKQLEESLTAEGDTHTEVTTGINDNRKQLEMELERQRAELNAQMARQAGLDESLAVYKEQYATLGSQRVELDRLNRDVALAEESYRKYRENLEESKISVALDKQAVSNVSVVQGATKPFEPIRPKRARNIAVGVLLGVLGGIGLAFLLDYVDDSMRTDADVERRLGLSVLASISEDEFGSCISNTIA
jgi:succinoglycan biosynthesis transport protein ExoP